MTDKQVVSSRWTLFLKLLFPTFWACSFGGITLIMLFFLDLSDIQAPFSPTSARILVSSFFISSMGMFYLLFMRVKWVALDKEHLYVSNFFKNYKYTYDSISKLSETKVLFLFHRITIEFHQPTSFGKSIFFHANYYWKFYLKEHPEVLQKILGAMEGNNQSVDVTEIETNSQ